MGKKSFNLAADMKTASARTQRPIAVQRLACTVHPLKSSEACPQGAIQPMSRHAATKNTAFPEFLSQSFLKLGCARLIRQLYAQLHLSKSPSYRRAVGRSVWCLAHGQHRRIVAQGPDRRGTERTRWWAAQRSWSWEPGVVRNTDRPGTVRYFSLRK